MKKLLFLLLLLASFKGNAQGLSLGLSAGLSKMLTVGRYTNASEDHVGYDSVSYMPGSRYGLNKGLFLRYHSKGRFAMELAANNYSQKENTFRRTSRGPIYPSHDVITNEKQDFYVFSLSFQYGIGLSNLDNHPFLGRFTPYIGAGIGALYSAYSYHSTSALNYEIYEHAYKSRLQLRNSRYSLSYLLNYRLNKRFNVRAKVLFEFDPININWKNIDGYIIPISNARIAESFGISYNIY